MEKLKFVIAGAGISGLSQAYFLFKRFPKCSIKILEQSNRLGGSIKSTKIGEYLFEEGPRSFRNSYTCKDIYTLMDDVGLTNDIIPSTNMDQVFIFHDGRLRQIPQALNFQTLYRFYQDHPGIVPQVARWVLQAYKLGQFNKDKPLKQAILKNDISVADYIDLIDPTETLKRKFVETMFYGIHGASVDEISAQIGIYKKHYNYIFYQPEDKFQKISLSENFNRYYQEKIKTCKSFRLRNGNESLVTQIHEYLQYHMKDRYVLNLNTNIQRIVDNNLLLDGQNKQVEYNKLFLNIPQKQLIQLLDASFQEKKSQQLEEITQILKSRKMTGINSTNIYLESQIIPKKFLGTGFLINPRQKQKLLGSLFDHLSHPYFYPQNSSSVSFMVQQGHRYSVEELVEEFCNHIQIPLSDVQGYKSLQTYWEDVFPIYAPNHIEKSLRLIDLTKQVFNSQVYIGGNILFTPAIPELVSQSKWITNKLL